MNVAELVVACLENEGVRHVFALPGEETLALGLALEDSPKITQIVVRHEQGAAFMADAYGRLTGQATPSSLAFETSIFSPPIPQITRIN